VGEISLGVPRDTKIRRYMSLDKFKKLLDSQALYFSRFDSFDDHLEGGINSKNFPSISNEDKVFDAAMNSGWPAMAPRSGSELEESSRAIDVINSETFPSLFGTQLKINGSAYLRRISSWLYASCWTDLPHECSAMWQLYGCSGSNCRHEKGCADCEVSLGNTVCIETTIGAVVDNLKLKKGYNLSIQKVDYLDHRSEEFTGSDIIMRPFFSKALHFSYENEVRFLLWEDNRQLDFTYKYVGNPENGDKSHQLDIINLDSLIGKIILSPSQKLS
jgi:hypothetical protein